MVPSSFILSWFLLLPAVLSQASHRQRDPAGVQGWGRRVGSVPQRPRRLCPELLPGQGGGTSSRGRRSQDLPERLHQGGRRSHADSSWDVLRAEGKHLLRSCASQLDLQPLNVSSLLPGVRPPSVPQTDAAAGSYSSSGSRSPSSRRGWKYTRTWISGRNRSGHQ